MFNDVMVFWNDREGAEWQYSCTKTLVQCDGFVLVVLRLGSDQELCVQD